MAHRFDYIISCFIVDLRFSCADGISCVHEVSIVDGERATNAAEGDLVDGTKALESFDTFKWMTRKERPFLIFEEVLNTVDVASSGTSFLIHLRSLASLSVREDTATAVVGRVELASLGEHFLC